MTPTMHKLAVARTRLINRQPFWGSLVMSLIQEVTEEVARAATDGTSLFWNPGFVEQCSTAELEGTMVHEVYHCMLRHFARRMSRKPELWNMACDYAINIDVIKGGWSLPSFVAYLHDLKYAGWSAEEIYNDLLRDQDSEKKGKGSDFGSVMDPKAADPVETEKLARGWEQRIKDAVAAAAGIGQVPDVARRILKELEEARHDWVSELRRFLIDGARNDYSFARPNRRYLWQGQLLPGYISTRPNKVAFIRDTSGSVGEREWRACLSEVQGALDEGACDLVQMASAATGLVEGPLIEAGNPIETGPQDGGGTHFGRAMQWAAEQEGLAGVVFFTDAETASWGEDPEIPVLWACWGRSAHRAAPPFGEKIIITTEH